MNMDRDNKEVFHQVEYAQVLAVEPPPVIAQSIDSYVWGVMGASNNFSIRQHVKLFPKSCCTCPPCVKQENTYSVYAGLQQDSMAEFLRIDEVSDDWNRCCCAPYHPLRLEVRPYMPMPGDGTNSDYAHMSRDMQTSFQSMTPFQKNEAIQAAYKQVPPIMTMIRNDGQRCCRLPCKLLSTFVCFSCCQDGIEVYAGSLEDAPDQDKGRPYNLDQTRLIGSAVQPVFGGYCWPTLHLRGPQQKEDVEPFGKIQGPCCFGGWSEMCFDFDFTVSTFAEKSHAGDLGHVVKTRPKTLTNAMVQLFSEADNYTIQFNQQAKLTTEQKVTVLGGQLLADYMFFEGNTEKCENKDDGIHCYLCYSNIFGCLCPWQIIIPKNSG